MQFAAITILAFVAVATANPISVSNNNIGDIVTIGVSANAVVSSNIEQNIVTLLAALLNQQALVASSGSSSDDLGVHHDETAALPELHEFNISPELVEKVKSHISPALIEKVKSYLSQE